MSSPDEEGLYRSYIENAPIGVFVVDETGTFVDANAAGCALLGYAREDLLDRSIADVSADSTAAADAVQRLTETGRLRTEQRLVHSDGHEVPVSVDAVAVSETRFIAYCQDSAEQREYERRLEESEARYRSLATALDTASVGTFILDSEFSVVWVNDAIERFFGIERADLVGADKAEKVSADIKHIFEEPAAFEATVLASYRDNSYVESFTCHVLPDGDREERWLLHWSTPIERGLYAGGRIEHYTDITTSVRYERQLEDQRDDLRVLNEVMRHDIRNDLQVVLANAEFLLDRVDPAVRDHVETILASAEEAVDLTRTARETADMLVATEADHTEVGLRTVLEGELEAFRETNPDVVLTVETTLPPVFVRADSLLGSVFRNLLKNAVQHNDAAVPTVRVAAEERPGAVVVRVVDNGPGVADERKEEVFGKHEKGIESAGTGLGLYLVRTLVESYGGSVHVEDSTTDDGAVFVVELPTVG